MPAPRRDGRQNLANGGRVLNVCAIGKTVAEAQARAYAAVDRIDWPEGFCRRDIGWRAVEREQANPTDRRLPSEQRHREEALANGGIQPRRANMDRFVRPQ